MFSRKVCALLVAMVGVATIARGAPFITSGPYSPYNYEWDEQNWAGKTWGYDFTVGSKPLTVDKLGMWDKGLDGFAGPQLVGIFDFNTQTLLVQVTIPASGAELIGEYRYAALISQLVLAANTKYLIAFRQNNTPDLYRWGVGATGFTYDSTLASAPANTWVNASVDAGLLFPNLQAENKPVFGPNFNVVPEPGALTLLALAGLALLRRRR